MGPQTKQIIAAAWAELLGVAGIGSGQRLLKVNDAAEAVSFVRLFGQGILIGPQWALDRAGNLSDEELAKLSVLGRLASDHGARPLGAAELSYADTRVEHADLPMTQEEAAVAALEEACSPEDVDEVGLGSMPHRWVLLEPHPSAGVTPVRPVEGAPVEWAPVEAAPAPAPEPLAGAGYVVWAGRLAHMGVLTSPLERGRGYGLLAAAVGTNAALEAGLIPQWRARWDNEPSKRLAQVLGYELVGSQTTVLIDPS